MSIFICPKCGYNIKTSRLQHVNSCKGNGPRSAKKILYPGKRGGWNKDIPCSEKTKTRISDSLIGKTCSKETRDKLSIKSKLNGSGGYIKGGGRGIKGWYKGFWCDSSWELAWIIYQLDNNIEFIRNKEGFEYVFENKKRKYYPDFILNTGEYIEIKGYITEQVKEKIKQFPHKLNVIGKYDIEKYIIYAKEKYGNDFIKLYGE